MSNPTFMYIDLLQCSQIMDDLVITPTFMYTDLIWWMYLKTTCPIVFVSYSIQLGAYTWETRRTVALPLIHCILQTESLGVFHLLLIVLLKVHTASNFKINLILKGSSICKIIKYSLKSIVLLRSSVSHVDGFSSTCRERVTQVVFLLATCLHLHRHVYQKLPVSREIENLAQELKY